MDIENIAVRGWKYKRFGWKRSILVINYASTLCVLVSILSLDLG